jgi:hypothetical protein
LLFYLGSQAHISNEKNYWIGDNMPKDYEPYPDPGNPKRQHAPKALARLRAKLTYEKQLIAFREVFIRDPVNDDELEAFIEEYTLELYNSGMDE